MNCSVSHFPTCIACIPQLLHILITLLGFFLFTPLTVVCTVRSGSCPLPLLKSLGIPGQRHVKAIRQKASEVFFSGHWGDFKAMSQKQADVVAVFHSLLHWHEHTHTQIHLHTYRHTHAYTEKQPHMAHCHTHRLPCGAFRERECEVKQTNACTPLRPTLLSLNITSLTAPLVPSSSASSYEIWALESL